MTARVCITHRVRSSRFRRARQHGSALIEYIVVALFIVLVLLAVGPESIQQLMTNLRQAYTAFVYAISASWI
jgi:Flp pilus assembly pilin Flp